MSKCLVTGCAGFIGHHLVRRLLELGHEVIGIDDLSTGTIERVDINQHKRFSFIRADLTQAKQVKVQVPKEIDYIFHLAAIPRVPISLEFPGMVMRNNILSTLNVMELARETGAKMIYSSSSSVYGDQEVFPTKEDAQIAPKSPYALSKWMGEELCEEYFQRFGVKYVALRYFNVYGPGMSTGGYATAIKIFLDQKRAGEPLTITGDGEQERDFTHVDDIVQANIKAMGPEAEILGAFNIGSGSPKSMNYVASLISKNVEHVEERLEPKKTYADNKKAKKILGWKPTRKFEEAMSELIKTEL